MLLTPTRTTALATWRRDTEADGTRVAVATVPGGGELLPDVRISSRHADAERSALDALTPVLPRLGALANALLELRPDTVAAAVHDLAPFATTALQALRDSHLAAPDHLPTQRALALCCVAAGRAGEAVFHLFRAIPGQYHMLAVGPRPELLRVHPEAHRAVVLAANASRCLGRADLGKRLLVAWRTQLDVARTAEITATFPPHVLWRRPDIVRTIRGVVQVGANVGDELPCWGRLGIRTLVAFEPVPAAYEALVATTASHAPAGADWRTVPVAISDERGTLPFWVGEQTGNSSFLELHPDRSAFHKQNRHAHRIDVPTVTLDDWFGSEPAVLAACNLLYIDVQGVEHRVLVGARRSLRAFDFVVLELSETEIYAGSWTAPRMDALMVELGFRRIDAAPNGFPEQLDAIYARIA